LLRELVTVPEVELHVEYAHRDVPDYPLAAELVDEIVPAYVYGSRVPNLRLLARAVFSPRDRWLLVAWSNPTTRALIVWFWLSRTKFNCWIDVPPETTRQRMILRSVALFLLRKSRVQMFAVGSVGVKYLDEAGFPAERVHNLPIALSAAPSGKPSTWRAQLGVTDDGVLLVTGSRLTSEKGFDVLIQALSQLQPEAKGRLVTVIVGHGPLEGELRRLAREARLSPEHIRFLNWLPADDFAGLVEESDIVVHPARSDSYGGASLLARAMAKPLIASRGAGAALDIVEEGENGWLYGAEDADRLTAILDVVVTDDELRAKARQAMGKISQEGSPKAAVIKLMTYAW
jgi:glycosyltransferase involved in cell wall biosynthesis